MSFLSDYLNRREQAPRAKLKGRFPRRIYLRFPRASDGYVSLSTLSEFEGKRLDVVERDGKLPPNAAPDMAPPKEFVLVARPYVGGSAASVTGELAVFSSAEDARAAMTAFHSAVARGRWHWLWWAIGLYLAFQLMGNLATMMVASVMTGPTMSAQQSPLSGGAGPLPLPAQAPVMIQPPVTPKQPPAMAADPFGLTLSPPTK